MNSTKHRTDGGLTRGRDGPHVPLERLVAQEQHEYWSALPHLRPEDFRNLSGHKQLTDFYLAKLAAVHEAKLATFDSRIHVITTPETLELIARS